MNCLSNIKHYRVTSLPSNLTPNAIYYVLVGEEVEEYIVDNEGIARRVGGQAGSGGGTISAGSSSIALGQVIFSNANSVTFGLNGSTLTASVSAGNPIFLSNSNGVTFGSIGSVVTASISASQVTDYISTNQSSLFQQTSLMSDYLNTNYTTHTHSQYLNTSQSSLFQQTSQMTDYLGTDYTSHTHSQYLNTSQSSLFRHTSNDSQLQFTSQMSDYALTDHTHSQYINTSQSSLFQHTSATSAITSNALNTSQSSLFRHTSADSQLQFTSQMSDYLGTTYTTHTHPAQTGLSAIILSNTTYTSGTISLRDGNGVSWASTTGQGISVVHELQYSSNTSLITSNALNTSQSSLFQHTSATSAITSNALHSSASRVVNIMAATNNTGGGTASLSSNVSFSAANNITFYTSAGNAIVASFSQSVDTGKAGTGFTSAGNNIGLSGTLNTNGLSLSATVAAQTNQTAGVYAVGNTTGQSSSSTYDARTLSVDGGGIVSVGWSNSTLRVSATQSNQALSGSNGSFTFQTATFGNVNGLSFYTSNGSMVGSYTVPTQSNQTIGIYASSQTTGQSSSSTVDARSLSIRGAGIVSVGLSGGEFIVSATGGGGGLTNINLSAGTTSNNLSAFTLADSNGISFGLNGSVVTATVQTNYLTTAALSSQTLAFTLSGNSATTNSSQISNGGYALAGGNGVTLAQSNNTVSISVATNYQSQGAYLTTAAQSTQTNAFSLGGNSGTTNSSVMSAGGYLIAGGSNITLSMSNNSLSIHAQSQSAQPQNLSLFALGNTTQNSSTVLSANALSLNAIGSLTVGYSNGSIQFSAPNALTTAMASNRGSDFVQATAGFNGTNASGTIASNAISVSVAAQSNQTVGIYGSSQTTGSASSGTHDARSLSIIGAGIISVGNHSTSAGGTTTGIVISATQSGQALSGSNGSFAFQTATFGSSNGMHFYTTNGSLVGSYTVPTVTNSSFSVQDSATTLNPVARIAFSTGNNITLTLSTGASSATVGVAHNLAGTSSGFGGNLISGSMTHNSSGLNLSLNHPAWLTTAAQSTQTFLASLSGNTATTNSSQIGNGGFAFAGGNGVTLQQSNNTVSWSVATSYRASNDAIGLNTAQTNVTWTANSAGLSLNAAGYAGTGTTFNGANISGSITQNSVGLNLSLSVAAPGAAAENNWHHLLGANTAGNTTASGSTIGLSGINLTLSGTNGSAINISAPATSSISVTGGLSASTNGSTISLGFPNVLTYSGFNPYAHKPNVFTSQGNGSFMLDPEFLPNVQFDRLIIPLNNTNSSNSSGSHTLSFWVGFYTKNASTLSLLTSASASTALTHSGTAGSYSLYSGMRLFTIPMTATLTEGQYWIGFISRTTSGGANGSYSYLGISQLASNFLGHFGSSHNTTYQYTLGQGVYTATTSALPNSLGFTQLRGSDNGIFRSPIIMLGSGTV